MEPLISVVVPVGPGHAQYVGAALASVAAQTLPAALVETIVINDTAGQYGGAGAARNAGLAQATAPLITWLDADDYLVEGALSSLLIGYAHYNDAYVYGDWWDAWRDGRITYRQAHQYSQVGTLKGGLHLVTTLMATADARSAGGWGDWHGWEDWEFWSRCAVRGLCGVRVAYPVVVYRHALGFRREGSAKAKADLHAAHAAQFGGYLSGEEPFMACGCGNKAAKTAARRAVYALGLGNGEEFDMADGTVRMEFIGPSRGPVTWRSQKTKETYRGANNATNKYINARSEDVEWLESLGVWRRVPRMPSVAPQPPQPPVPVEWAKAEPAEVAEPTAAPEKVSVRKHKRTPVEA
jgi:hypothetical protein